MRDVSNTVAFAFLEEMLSKGKISQETVDLCKTNYRKLHEAVVQCFANEKALMEKAMELSTVLEEERSKIESKIGSTHDMQTDIEQLQREADEINAVVQTFQNEVSVCRFELEELQATRRENEVRREQNEVKQLAELQPIKERLAQRLAELQADLLKQKEAKEREDENTQAYLTRIAIQTSKINDNEKLKLSRRAEYTKVMGEPERIRQQVATLEVAQKKLQGEVREANEAERRAEAEYQATEQARADKEAQCDKSASASDQLRSTVFKLQVHADELQGKKLAERERAERAKDKSALLEQELAQLQEMSKKHFEQMTEYQRQYEKAKKEYERQRRKRDSLQALVPPLKAQHESLMRLWSELERELADKQKILSEIKMDEELFTAQVLNKEDLERETKALLQAVLAERREVEAKVAQADAQEKALLSDVGNLSAQRERMAREASLAMEQYVEATRELKAKNMLLMALDKQTLETYQKLKVTSVQYEKVKTSRNRFQSLLQAAVQTIAELNEKIKLLQSESDTLRQESLGMNRTLVDEARTHSNLVAGRDAARIDHNKLVSILDDVQERERQHETEIVKLNSIVNQTEVKMLELRRDYAAAVDNRNLTGIQLIDRNDELCILYEKSNVQQNILAKGDAELRHKDDQIRAYKLEISELRRKVENARRRLPSLQMYAACTATLQRLEEQLRQEREITSALTVKLEEPAAAAAAAGDNAAGEIIGAEGGPRCRLLKGSDPAPEVLASQITILGERLNAKKEQLLERDLVLDEVTSLSDKLKVQAAETRGSTLDLAKRINDYQARIRTMSRKIMAVISELSMYQATAMKLEQQRAEAAAVLQTARDRVSAGAPPTDDAEYEWYRLERDRVRRQEALMERLANEKTMLANAQRAAQGIAVKTMAEARPNHYLPEELALPKPYGALAPFKPQQAGTTIRHIRKPEVRELQL
jgi:chromosome segregation ATPase